MCTICDRRTDLGIAIRRIGIIPVIALAAFDLAAQIGRIFRRCITCQRIKMAGPVPPVAERGIPVQPDEIDVCVRPQIIERKIHIP